MAGAGDDPVGDRVRQLDHTIVRTLAHLGCASFEQLHALCFPNAVLATARLKLNTLIEAGVIMHSSWRLPARSRLSGHVWTITQHGLDMLARDGTTTTGSIPDMGRPSTGREYEEWRVRLLVRTFVVRLILEARQDPLCANLSATFWLAHPTPLGSLYAAQPDALLAVRWEPATVQAPDWLPWCGAAAHHAAATRYPIYAERQGNVASLDQLIERSVDQPASDVPLVLMSTADRQRIAADLLRRRGYSQIFRMAHWGALQASVDGRVWRDAAGEARKLRLDAGEAHELEQSRAFEA